MKEFEEYIRQGEPQKCEKVNAWQTAIGLQAVDGLNTSDYLIQTARHHIEGDITIEEAKQIIDSYYQSKCIVSQDEDRTEEADKVAVRIAEILSENSFNFSPIEYISIHKRLFEGIYPFAGILRDYNISKKEWVLRGGTVIYSNATTLKETLEYDFDQEKRFNYRGIGLQNTISHLTRFVADLWQIHPFGEGNTRTTALFTIKYLRTLGFNIDNDQFAANSWYFRNALVRANYNDIKGGIYATTEYLELFFRNLLMNEHHVLRNRNLLISAQDEKKIETPLSPTNVGSDTVNETYSDTANDTVNDTVNGTYSNTINDIVKAIMNNPSITLNELAIAIGKSRSTIARQIKKLQTENIICRVGSDKSGYWKVIK